MEKERVWACFGDKRGKTSWTSLGEVEKALPNESFFRVQRDLLVQADNIQSYRHLPGGRIQIQLSTGVEMEVSRAATAQIKAYLDAQ